MRTSSRTTNPSLGSTMTKPFDSLDETFDITPMPEVTPKGKLTKKDKAELISVSEDSEKDFSYVRGKLYQMAEKLSEAAEESLETAMESSHPRAFEVTGNLMKQTAEVADMILTLQEKHKRHSIDDVKVQATQNNTTNNVFLGSTSDLMKMLKENK